MSPLQDVALLWGCARLAGAVPDSWLLTLPAQHLNRGAFGRTGHTTFLRGLNVDVQNLLMLLESLMAKVLHK